MRNFLPTVLPQVRRISARRYFAFALALLLAPQALAWPDLRIGKIGPAQAAPGEVITYTLSYTNSGPVKSTSVVMKDFVPANVLVLTSTLNGGTLSGSTITWSLGTLNSKTKGSRTFQVRINTNAPSGSFITNRVQIFGKEAEEPGDTNDNSAKWITAIVGVNRAPAANDDAYTTTEDTTLTIPAPGILANDSDADGDALTALLVSNPTHGALTLNANGSFSYAPNSNYHGVDTFTYRARDGTANSTVATVCITVTPVNDRPVAQADQYSTWEDSVLNVAAPGVLANDSDADGDPLTAALATPPTNGVVNLNPNGSFSYLPNSNYHGLDSFTYRANDGMTNSGKVTVSITVMPVNDAPVALNDTYTVAENSALIITAPGVLANDSDADGDALTAILVNGPTQGTLTLNANGGFSYTPNPNYHGPDSFTYRANDAMTNSGIATVTFNVTPGNDAPVAVADNYEVMEDTGLSIAAPGVLVNDSDPDGDLLTAILVTGPEHGTLTLNSNGGFTYLPNSNYHGADSFTYRAHDALTNSGVVTVTLNVVAVNDAPVAQDDNYEVAEEGTLTIAGPGVLGNDSDPDGDVLTAILVAGPTHGTLTLNPNGGFVYQPNANYNGPDLFTYRAHDGFTNSEIATVRFNVTPVNHPPDTNNWSGHTFIAFEDTALNVAPPGVLAGIVDGDGDLLTVTPVTATTNGAFNLTADGSFSYVPNPNFNGADSFQFLVSDGTTNRLLTANITVLPVNDAPSFVKGSNFRLPHNAGPQSIPGWATAISPGPADESGQTVVFQVTNDQGALFAAPPAISSNGTLTFTPANNASGTATVTVVARDNGGTANGGVDASVPQTFTIFINAPPTVRIASPSEGASFFAPASFTLLAEAEDVDGSVVKVELFSGTNEIAEVTSGEPFFTVLTNLPVGIYTFGAIATDDFGATGSATPVSVSVIARPPLTYLTTVYYNPQRDFFEQRVRVTNPTYSTLDAVRILVFNLTNVPPITVGNRTGFTNGIPYVQSSGAVPPGSYVDLTIEYLSPLRIMPNPILQAALVPPTGSPGPLQGTFQPINRGLWLANQTFLVEFATFSNRVYAIQYSGNLADWLTAQPAITGDGNWIQWIDNGEPKTIASPAAAPARFYRLLLLP